MSNPKEVICLCSSDSESEDELLQGSFLTRARHQPLVTESSSSSSSSNSPTNAAAGVAAATKKGESCKDTANSSGNAPKSAVTAAAAGITYNDKPQTASTSELATAALPNDKSKDILYDKDSDDESMLEVLPAQTPATKKSWGDGPRLSYSGQSARDPVVNFLLHEASSPLVEDDNLRARLTHRMTTTTTVAAAVPRNVAVGKSAAAAVHSQLSDSEVEVLPVAPPKQSQNYNSDDDDDDDWDRKPSALSKSTMMCAGDESSSSDDDSLLLSQSLSRACQKPAVQPPPKQPSSILYTSDEDSDASDDSFAVQCRQLDKRRAQNAAAQTRTARRQDKENTRNVQATKQAAKEQRQLERQKAKAAKEQAKQAAREQRQRERLAKQEAQQAAKRQRLMDKEKNFQARGRFANQEIVVLAEPDILDTYKVQDTLTEAGFAHVRPYPSGLSCQVLQFIRQDYLQGGAEKALQDLLKNGPPRSGQAVAYEHIGVVAVVVPAETLVDLIQDEASPRNAVDDDDYPKLEQWLFGLVTGWRAAWHKTTDDRPRIILLLYKITESLDRLWVQYRTGGRSGRTPPTTEQFHDAVLWMLIQFQVESIHCHSPEDLSHEILKMTRFLAEAPYAKQATELQTFAKLPAHVNDMAPDFDRAQDTWIRQLQQIPRLSADMARNVSMHYPTALSLWKVYQDETMTEDEKRFLLTDLFGTKSAQSKLSNHVYLALTSDDPQEILH